MLSPSPRSPARAHLPHVRTSRASYRAERVAVCAGAELHGLFADRWTPHALSLCQLQMLRVRPPADFLLNAALMADLSLVRYEGYSALPEAQPLLRRLSAERHDAGRAHAARDGHQWHRREHRLRFGGRSPRRLVRTSVRCRHARADTESRPVDADGVDTVDIVDSCEAIACGDSATAWVSSAAWRAGMGRPASSVVNVTSVNQVSVGKWPSSPCSR